MKKVIKTLCILIIVGIFAIVYLKSVVKEATSVEEKIGTYEPMEVSMEEYYTIEKNILGKYFELIKDKEYKIAYLALSQEYRDFISYDEYVKKVEAIDIATIVIKDIKIKNTNTYIATLLINDEEKLYTIYINNISNQYSISPDNFLKADTKSVIYEKGDFKLTVKKYIVEHSKVTFDIEIVNKQKNKDLQLEKIYMVTDDSLEYSCTDEPMVIKVGDTYSGTLECEAPYRFPAYIRLERRITEKQQVKLYTISLK